MGRVFGGPLQQDRYKHQTGAVRRGHQKGPEDEILTVHTHADPAWMPGAEELREPQGAEHQRRQVVQKSLWEDHLEQPDQQQYHRNGERMSEGNGDEGPEDDVQALLLQAERHGEEPAHTWIYAVEGAQHEQNHPRP